MTFRGVMIQEALSDWRECRAAFQDYRQAVYSRAHEECGGNLLNALGRKKGIDPWSLFIGSHYRARLYASAELLAFWDETPRLSFQDFEGSWQRWEVDPAWSR